MATERPQCEAVVYVRDTRRRTGAARPAGFRVHYSRRQCRRLAVADGLCAQHLRLAGGLRDDDPMRAVYAIERVR